MVKVMAKIKMDGHIWELRIQSMFIFLFHEI